MKQVALRAGKPQQWLSDRLKGHSPIYADDLVLLARGLEIDPCDFFREVDSAEASRAQSLRPRRESLDDLDQIAPDVLRTLIDFLEWQRQRADRTG